MFQHFAARGYGQHLLPIIPPTATISPFSENPEQISANRGKTPGKLVTGGWVGFHDFPNHVASETDLARWAKWGAGVGINARCFPAFDIDVDDADVAEAIHGLIADKLGPMPARFGRPPRRLLMCRAADGARLAKRRLRFTLNGVEHIVEFLGDGQQYVIAGVHPKTGKPYTWDSDTPDAGSLTRVDGVSLDEVFEAISEYVRLIGGELVTLSQGSSSVARAEVAQEGLLAPSLEAVAAALDAVPNDVDYDTWVRVGVAIKGATGGSEDGRELWLDWSAQYSEDAARGAETKWDSFHPPFKLGWDFLARFAGRSGFNAAAHEFDAVEAPAPPPRPAANEPLTHDQLLDAIIEDTVWVESLKRAFSLTHRRMFDREQFNVLHRRIGDPSSSKGCAWATWQRVHDRFQEAAGITYRPGKPQFVHEPDIGRCLNIYVPSPVAPSDDDASRWVEHVKYMYPDPADHEPLFDWFAWLVQRIDEKPPWQVIMGSEQEGLGKDMCLEPICLALGNETNLGRSRSNVRTVDAVSLSQDWTDWAEATRLVIVEEMQAFGKRELSNTLKPYLTSPPHTVTVRKKFQPAYETPNTFGMLFFTNSDAAMHVPETDRRLHIVFSSVKPRDGAYYAGLKDWYGRGGVEAVYGWLMRRDISRFERRAPTTVAKQSMQRQSLSRFEEWLNDGLADGSGPFSHDIVSLSELYAAVPRTLDWKGTEARMAAMLRSRGAQPRGRHRIGAERHRLYSLRRHATYEAMTDEEIVRRFTSQDRDPFKVSA